MKWLLGIVGGVVVVGLALAGLLGENVNASPGTMPPQYRSLYEAAARTCPGLPVEVLMAVGQIESGHGANPGPSVAGAVGPMQFMPFIWDFYGVDGNGDGVADPWDPADAIPSAANLLCADGAGNPDTLEGAIALYNPGDPTYAAAVLEVAAGYHVWLTGTPTATARPQP